MKPIKEFPRSFRSSSAALRAVRQFEEKTGTPSGLVMVKISDKVFLVSEPEMESVPAKITFEEFNENKPKVSYSEMSFRYFVDGLNAEGYYEIKTGDRRRPNSKFLPIEKVYTDFVEEVCK